VRRIAGGSSVIRENGPLASVAGPAALPAFSAAVTFQTSAMIANGFFSPVIRLQTEYNHRLITRRDPYRLIRPRGYLGIIVTILASGLALRSWLALIPGLASTVVIIRRTACENQFLKMTLLGYTDYRGKVRYWLVPVMVRKTPVIAVTTKTRLEGTRSSLSKATLGVQPSPTFCVMPRPSGPTRFSISATTTHSMWKPSSTAPQSVPRVAPHRCVPTGCGRGHLRNGPCTGMTGGTI